MNPQTPRSDNFSEQLIAAQRVEPSLRQRYEQEMKNMLEQTLNPVRKISFTLSAVVSVGMAVALTIAALSTRNAPIGVRIGLGLGAVYGLAWFVLTVRILRRGAMHRRDDWRLMSALPWAFALALVTLMLIMTGRRADSIRSVWMLLYGLTFLLMASMFLVQYWIGEARMKLEERLLEVQLRVAELAEELKRRS